MGLCGCMLLAAGRQGDCCELRRRKQEVNQDYPGGGEQMQKSATEEGREAARAL